MSAFLPARVQSRPSLSGRFCALCTCASLLLACFYLPLSAAPAYAALFGGDVSAGFVTAALMGGTIVGEIAATKLIALLGRRLLFVLAVLALALPTPLAFSSSLAAAVAASAVRGAGLGVLLVAAGGFAAMLAPVSRRSEALGVYGFAAGLPAIICVPFGLSLLDAAGPVWIAMLATACGLAALIGAGVFPSKEVRDDRPVEGLSWRGQMWPAATLASGAIMAGAVVTFIPLYAQAAGAIVVSASLFVHGLTTALSRLIARRHGDRHGQHGIMVFGLLATALSAAAVASSISAVAILCGTAGLGVGFGLLQSGSLSLMLERAPRKQADAVSAAWNIAYDLGLGLGGLGFGLVSGAIGHGGAFVAAALIAVVLVAPLLRVARKCAA